MLTDSHAHLDDEELFADLSAILGRAIEAGVGRIVVPGVSLESSRKAVELAQVHPMIYAAVGIHPHLAKEYLPENRKELVALAAREKVVALGEIGLDYHYSFCPPEVQRQAFAAQLELASELDKPLILHSREADEDTYRLLRSAPLPGKPGVLHCYSSNWDWAQKFLEMGFYLGVTGVITFKKAEALREVVQKAPLSRLLIETDSPYLAPHPHRGKRNEPALVREVAETVAEVRGIPLEEVLLATCRNLNDLFGI